MIRGNKKYISVILRILVFCIPVVSLAYTETREILSNEIWGIDGHGDTLWLATSRGLNYTLNASGTSGVVSWRGFGGIKAWPVSFGGGRMIACAEASDKKSAQLWAFDHNDGENARLEKIKVEFGSESIISEEDTAFNMSSVSVVWSGGFFWVSSLDAGILRINADSGLSEQSINNNSRVYIPGNKDVYLPQSLPGENFSSGLGNNSVKSIYADDSGVVWAACSKSVWRFNPADTGWTKIAGEKICAVPDKNDSVSIGTYYDILTALENGQKVYVQAVNENDSIVYIYRYSVQTQEWRKFVSASKDAAMFERGSAGRIYTVYGNQIFLYRDTLADSDFPLDIVDSAEISGASFQKERFPSSMRSPLIYDLYYDISGRDTLFWAATSNGLFYSLDEHQDERDGELMQRIFREKSLKPGLEEVYAYPGILNDDYSAAVFAYNLDTDDRVTIDIYDFNMDHVVNIIHNEQRVAGKNREDGSGRSTDEKRDFWDGTFENDGGGSVAPGLYYFRIKTKKGKRAFGKIIIAKPR